MSTATPLLVKLSPLGHQAHTEQLVHHACTRSLGCELLQDVTQHICETSVLSQSQHTNPDMSHVVRYTEMLLIRCPVPSESLYSSKSISSSCSCSSVQRTIRVPFLQKKKQTKGLFKKRFAAHCNTTSSEHKQRCLNSFCVEHILLLLEFLGIVRQTHAHQLRHYLPASARAVAQQWQQSLHNIWH